MEALFPEKKSGIGGFGPLDFPWCSCHDRLETEVSGYRCEEAVQDTLPEDYRCEHAGVTLDCLLTKNVGKIVGRKNVKWNSLDVMLKKLRCVEWKG